MVSPGKREGFLGVRWGERHSDALFPFMIGLWKPKSHAPPPPQPLSPIPKAQGRGVVPPTSCVWFQSILMTPKGELVRIKHHLHRIPGPPDPVGAHVHLVCLDFPVSGVLYPWGLAPRSCVSRFCP